MEHPGFGKRVMDVLRAVYHMLRRGLCRKRLMMDLHLLLGRGRLAGRALRDVLLAQQPHYHGGGGGAAAGGGRLGGGAAADESSALSFYQHNPREVEFSCTTTPSYAPRVFPFRIRGRGARGNNHGGLDAAAVARLFEMLNTETAAGAGAGGEETPASSLPGATPSPLLALSLGRSPAGVRQLRVTDSPFPVETEGLDGHVDDKAADFIEWFHQQLRQQQYATPSPRRG
ncbi:hypothetical protein GUJ93_ZPchr0008g12798 [Zizania palustris]|uniref:Uncharacterized protein n=1 Tax=Zizania palustris TaxID=103762 RepID=A0A8J5RUK1_ZIZPA|nr:hypothetical protein GUJ93_ZPchr0008g12798 [Zizania palustris]